MRGPLSSRPARSCWLPTATLLALGFGTCFSPSAHAQTAPGSGPLQTGGLAPPSSPPPGSADAQVARQLDQAEREDAGRGLEFLWIDAAGGIEYVALTALSGDDLLPGVSTSGSGLSLSAGLGARLVVWSLGASVRLTSTNDWDLWSFGGRAALHLPMGSLEPSFFAEVSYLTLGQLPEDSGLEASGVGARLGAGFAWYANPLVSLGARADASLTVLGSSGAGTNGSGVGFGGSASGVFGLHF